MLKVLLFIILVTCGFSDDFFSDISKETEQKEGSLNPKARLDEGEDSKPSDNTKSVEIKSKDYLSTYRIPKKALFYYWIKQSPKDIKELLDIIKSYKQQCTFTNALVDDKTLMTLLRVDRTSDAFLIENQLKLMGSYSKSNPMRSVFIEIRNVLQIMDQSFSYLSKNYPKAYINPLNATVPKFLNHTLKRKQSSLHAYLAIHVVLSYLKSHISEIEAIHRLLEFTHNKQNRFKILYLSTALQDRRVDLLKQLTKMNIDKRNFFLTQGDRNSLGALLLSSLIRNPKSVKEFRPDLDQLQMLLDKTSIKTKQDLLSDKKWFHPHVKSLINDQSKETLIRLLLRVLPQDRKAEIQSKLRRTSHLELFEDSLVLSQSVREVSLNFTPKLIVSLRKSSPNFREFEMFFPRSYHFACRLIIAQYYQHLNESLIKQIPANAFQRLLKKFNEKDQKSFTIVKRNLLFSAKSLSILQSDDPKIEDSAFKKSWGILQRDLIWFHRLILSFKIDLDLHHFNFTKNTMAILQERLSKSVHFTDLFFLLTLKQKQNVCERFSDLEYFTLRLIEDELYLLEKRDAEQKLIYKESLDLYKYLNDLLRLRVQDLTKNVDDEKLKSLQSYYYESDYISVKNAKITIRSEKQNTEVKRQFNEVKQISKNLRNLIYLIQI